ncbi:MAG: hypothetical protein UIB61_05490 [Treponema sp.]|jgi:hypothetical protein|nr:hypothetical protein [Treponema sp.]
MKNLFPAILFFLLGSIAFSEIVSWKGMEFGLDSCPVWLEKYLDKKNEKPLRRKFGIERSKSVVVGVGSGESLESARSFSQTDAIKKYFASIKENQVAQSLCFVYEFWNEDSDSGFTVFSIYTF